MTHPTKVPAVNYIRHIDIFFDIVRISPAINYAHIALYISLFRIWNHAFFTNPISPARSEIMMYAGIKSKECYYRLLREISELDLIRYYPSKSRYETGLFCISKLEYVEKEIKISVWAVSNHESLNGKQIEIPFSENKNSTHPTVKPVHHKSQLINGRGILFIEKSFTLSSDVNNNHDEVSASTFDPHNDPRYTSQIDNRISSLSNNSNYANHQNSQSGRTGLRPPGVQIDPDADYSVPL